MLVLLPATGANVGMDPATLTDPDYEHTAWTNSSRIRNLDSECAKLALRLNQISSPEPFRELPVHGSKEISCFVFTPMIYQQAAQCYC